MYSKGVSWIDDCRIPFVDDVSFDKIANRKDGPYGGNSYHESITRHTNDKGDYNTQGRFPANILVCDDMLNDGLPSGNKWKKNYGAIDYKGLNYSSSTAQCQHGGGYTGNNTYADSGSSSRYYNIDKWFENLIK
jgi:hypothetical protein